MLFYAPVPFIQVNGPRQFGILFLLCYYQNSFWIYYAPVVLNNAGDTLNIRKYLIKYLLCLKFDLSFIVSKMCIFLPLIYLYSFHRVFDKTQIIWLIEWLILRIFCRFVSHSFLISFFLLFCSSDWYFIYLIVFTLVDYLYYITFIIIFLLALKSCY